MWNTLENLVKVLCNMKIGELLLPVQYSGSSCFFDGVRQFLKDLFEKNSLPRKHINFTMSEIALNFIFHLPAELVENQFPQSYQWFKLIS